MKIGRAEFAQAAEAWREEDPNIEQLKRIAAYAVPRIAELENGLRELLEATERLILANKPPADPRAGEAINHAHRLLRAESKVAR